MDSDGATLPCLGMESGCIQFKVNSEVIFRTMEFFSFLVLRFGKQISKTLNLIHLNIDFNSY